MVVCHWRSKHFLYLIPRSQTKVEEEKYCELDQAILTLLFYINIVAILTSEYK